MLAYSEKAGVNYSSRNEPCFQLLICTRIASRKLYPRFLSKSFTGNSDYLKRSVFIYTQPVTTCSKLPIETQEKGVKYVQS